MITLSDLSPLETEWFWHPRIPKGELTVLDGDPSVNKSSLLMDLAARVSTGREMPDGAAGTLGGVLLLLAEDSLRKTVLQRLEAAGADLGRIAVPQGAVVLPRDLPPVVEWACRMQAALVVIDPLIAFLGCDANSDRQVRWAMTPLKEFAERTNCAVVLVRHLTKRGGRHALYRGGGSIGIVAATRSAPLVGRPPDAPDLRVLCHVKSNLGPLAPSLSFGPVATPEGVVKIEWRGECDYYSPDDLLAPAKPGENRLAEAIVFLKELLSGGPVEQKVVKSKAAEAGVAYRTVERAKELLGVRSERHGWGPGSTCHWGFADRGPIERRCAALGVLMVGVPVGRADDLSPIVLRLDALSPRAASHRRCGPPTSIPLTTSPRLGQGEHGGSWLASSSPPTQEERQDE